ncbi:MAG: hypothetical protein FD155_2125 [Bacteroidetes bacterium]|nr:MAG: hypothetical protein FD155_2125 [Bacteroidota bacterium]
MIQHRLSTHLRANLLLLAAAAIWGLAFVAQRQGMDHLGPLTFNGIRFLLGALTLLIYSFFTIPDLKPKDLIQPRLLMHGIMAGMVLLFASGFQQLGMIYTTAGNAGFITSLYVLFVPVIGLLRRKPSSSQIWIGALFATVGLYLLSVKEGFHMQIGDVLVLISAIFWAFHLIILSYIAPQHDFRLIAFLQFFITGFISLLFAIFLEPIEWQGIQGAMIPILYTGIASAGIGFTLQIAGQRKARADHAAMILSLEAVFALVGGFLILQEYMSWKELSGAALMLIGVIITQYFPERKQQT